MDTATLHLPGSGIGNPGHPFPVPAWVPEMTPPPEIPALMQRIALRDSKALTDLYGRFSKVLYNTIFAIVKRKEDAEEILCEIFHQVWEKAPAYDISKGSVYTWLLAMARNRAIDRIRSKGFKDSKADAGLEVDDLAGPDHCNQLDQVVLSERAALIQSALEKISPDQRCVLEIAYFEGRTQTEIAAKLGVPLGTVKSRVRDGMKALQGLLKDLL
ncbi:MAG TPA: sigma-70 family RNA polymerase sigma factor [Fibrobacteria bacterium]|nr:sigma-70 family RNA polymerase sigma factor [Fibrobacteria bacterium]